MGQCHLSMDEIQPATHFYWHEWLAECSYKSYKLEGFADDGALIAMMVDVYDQAKQLLLYTYSNKSDNFESCDIATLNTFNNNTLLNNIKLSLRSLM